MRVVPCVVEFEARLCQTSRASRLDNRRPGCLMSCLLPVGKPELKGFNLSPLNQDELKALKIILKG